MFEEFVGGTGFGAFAAVFSDTNEFCVFEIIPKVAYDMSVDDEGVRGVADGAPVAVCAFEDV